jgi:hypothetical protein
MDTSLGNDSFVSISYKYNLLLVIDALNRVYRDLASEFDPCSLSEFAQELHASDRRANAFLSRWLMGSRRNIPLSRIARSSRSYDRLCAIADRALPTDSPLRKLYELGAALGEYESKLLPIQHVDYRGAHFNDLPDMDSIARSIEGIPQAVLNHIPLLHALAQLTSGRDTNPKKDFNSAFIRILKLYICENQNLDDPDYRDHDFRVPYRGDLFYRSYVHISNQLDNLPYEAIAPAHEERPSPNWEPNSGRLLVGNEVVKTLATQAKNQRAILDRFQAEGWPISTCDPLPMHHQRNPQQVTDTVKDLNDRLSKMVFHAKDGSIVWWDWKKDG